MAKELAWLQRDLKALGQCNDLYVTLGPSEELKETAYLHLRRYLFETAPLLPLREQGFLCALDQARARLPGLAMKFTERVGAILKIRQQLLLCRKPYPGMRADLESLLPRRFLEMIAFDRLEHLPRYLKAMLIRAERAALNPLKDQEKLRVVLPFVEGSRKRTGSGLVSSTGEKQQSEFRWLLEEFKVSVFAQELGTAQPVSAKRLREQFERMSGPPRETR
jgi:ATP-dependent helicase HrpA